MYVCMYVCMHVCMYVYMHACMYVCIYKYISVSNNFVQLSSNFCVKIATQIVNWVAICSI